MSFSLSISPVLLLYKLGQVIDTSSKDYAKPEEKLFKNVPVSQGSTVQMPSQNIL